jgi:enoyl-CoA hydratase
MSNSDSQTSDNPSVKDESILIIPVGDISAFETACERDATDENVRSAVLHLSGESIGPGMPATLAAVQAAVVVGLSGQIDDRSLELAMAADVRVCDASTTFALTKTGQGELPSDGATQRLPRLVGPGLAADMLLTGRRISAQEALKFGLVTEITPDGNAPERADQIAAEIAEHGRGASRFTKEAVIKGADITLEQSLRLEADLAILLHTDPERAEGIDAFNARRKPDFRPEDD